MKLFAPYLDDFLGRSKNGALNQIPDLRIHFLNIYEIMGCIKPEGDDSIRRLWIDIPRGTIEDFGDYEEFREEELVDSYEEFEQEWQYYYPDPVKWYNITIAIYQEVKYFYINTELCFSIEGDNAVDHTEEFHFRELENTLKLLYARISEVLSLVKNDVHGYNAQLEKNLSYQKRTGRIVRKAFWDILGEDAERLDEKLGNYHIDVMKTVVKKQKMAKQPQIHTGISADDFFRYCEICYDANHYFDEADEKLSPREKYIRMSDGRHGGLLDIDPGSKDDFIKWYRSDRIMGAHPWEICRGGNSTHISLMVSQTEGGWNLFLAGSSRGRVEETVRMAVALHENGILFNLHQGEEIFRMITGNDYIGIVPDHIFPRYCHGLFPAEDRIIDFMNLGHEKKEMIISNAYWYPLDPIEIL